MSANRYGIVLTIILTILILGIIGGLCFFGYSLIKPKNDEKNKQEAIEEFDRDFEIEQTTTRI